MYHEIMHKKYSESKGMTEFIKFSLFI